MTETKNKLSCVLGLAFKAFILASVAAVILPAPHYAGSLSDPLAAIIFSGFDHAAAYTIVNGEVVVDAGRLVGVAEEEIMQKGNAISARMLASAL